MAAQAARHLKDGDVCLWSRSKDQLANIEKSRENRSYLPGIQLPTNIALENNFSVAIKRLSIGDLLVIATPMSALSETIAQALKIAEHPLNIIWLCKGLEPATALLPHQVVEREDKLHSHGISHSYGALSGPSFAQEVAAGLPTALTVASGVSGLAARLGQVLHGPSLRVYSSDDVIGVEVGGAVKNVMAIAAGISDGLGLGLNARAALITRGLAEMTRFGIALGGRAETFGGLSGMGDLLLTATGDLSRNRQIGLALARGVVTSAAQASLGHVAEGVFTASEVWRRAQALGVEMPITAAVCELLEHPNHAAIVVQSLLARDARAE
jgi:glycerol-3-phosphate dehydrogenase (NAD(P)+)